jgi:integrase
VRRNKEKPRSRYVTDDEFQAALDRSIGQVQDLLELAYLTGLRQGDLRRLKRSQIKPDVIEIQEEKTGKRLAIEISPALRKVLMRAQSRCDSIYVLTNSKGQPWGLWAIQSFMRRLDVDWTFHDLRAKAESDHKTGLGLMASYKRAKTVTAVR